MNAPVPLPPALDSGRLKCLEKPREVLLKKGGREGWWCADLESGCPFRLSSSPFNPRPAKPSRFQRKKNQSDQCASSLSLDSRTGRLLAVTSASAQGISGLREDRWAAEHGSELPCVCRRSRSPGNSGPGTQNCHVIVSPGVPEPEPVRLGPCDLGSHQGTLRETSLPSTLGAGPI